MKNELYLMKPDRLVRSREYMKGLTLEIETGLTVLIKKGEWCGQDSNHPPSDYRTQI